MQVTGKALPSSNDVGDSNDPAIGMTVPTITGQGFDGSKVTFANDGKPRVVICSSPTGARTARPRFLAS